MSATSLLCCLEVDLVDQKTKLSTSLQCNEENGLNVAQQAKLHHKPTEIHLSSLEAKYPRPTERLEYSRVFPKYGAAICTRF
jgi:hypothetical protein